VDAAVVSAALIGTVGSEFLDHGVFSFVFRITEQAKPVTISSEATSSDQKPTKSRKSITRIASWRKRLTVILLLLP
jgi:hypothetical protein